MINPADWYTLRVAKASGTGEYFGGGFFGAQNIPNLWGIPVCVTAAVNAGTAIVGAFKTCASVVTLAVRRPKGFKIVSKGAGGATGATAGAG